VQNVTNQVRDGFLSLHTSAVQLLCNDYESVEPIAQGQTFSFYKEFTKFSLPYLTEINRRVKESLAAQKLPVVPMIVFAKGAHYALAQLGQSGYEVVGLDWTVRPDEARRLVGDTVSLQVRIGFIYLLGSWSGILSVFRYQYRFHLFINQACGSGSMDPQLNCPPVC
jgi:hypothetical protein